MNTRVLRSAALAATLLVAGAATARAAVPFGVSAGLTESRFRGSNGDDLAPNYRPGVDLALWTRVPVRRMVDIRPELHWIVKGGQGDFEFLGSSTHVEYSLKYIELPVLLRLGLPGNGTLEPFVVAGPAVAVKVDARGEIDLDEITIPLRAGLQRATIYLPARGIDEHFASWDFGVVGGAGLSYAAGRARFLVEARYEHGFVDVLDIEGVDVTNALFSATLGVELH